MEGGGWREEGKREESLNISLDKITTGQCT